MEVIFILKRNELRKISDAKNDNRDYQSLEEIWLKMIEAAKNGYPCIKVGNLQDDVIKALKDNEYQLYRENIKTDYGYEFLGILITW